MAYLGDRYEHGQIQGTGDGDVLPGHHLHAHVAAHHQHAVVGHQTSESEERGLEILFVAAEVDQRDGVVALLHHLGPAVRVIARSAIHLSVLCVNRIKVTTCIDETVKLK